MTKALDGKVAVVTGASQGIGEACAKAMLEVGARVVVIARDLDKLNVAFSGYNNAIPLAADLLKESDRENLVTRVLDKTGKIDIFLANAGMYVGGNLLENDSKQIEKVLTLNVNGAIAPAIDVLKYMVKDGVKGDVVVMDSIAGRRHPSYEPVYGPSKMAAAEFADLARVQMSPHGIRVGSISSACVETPLVESWEPARLAKARANGEFISSKDVAEEVVHMVTRPRHLAIINVTMAPTKFDKI